MKNSKNRGITLIVLIITVIIMLILIAVVIDIAIDGKLIDSAKEAVEGTNDKVGRIQNRVDELTEILDNVKNEEEFRILNPLNGSTISLEEDYQYEFNKTPVKVEIEEVICSPDYEDITRPYNIYSSTEGKEIAIEEEDGDRFIKLAVSTTGDIFVNEVR